MEWGAYCLSKHMEFKSEKAETLCFVYSQSEPCTGTAAVAMAGGIRPIPSRFVPFAGHDQFVHGSVHHPIASRHLQSYIIVLGGSIRVFVLVLGRCSLLGFSWVITVRFLLLHPYLRSCWGLPFSLYLLFNNHMLRCLVRIRF